MKQFIYQFLVIIYPHLCKITAQLLFIYFEMAFSQIYLVGNLLFWYDHYISFSFKFSSVRLQISFSIYLLNFTFFKNCICFNTFSDEKRPFYSNTLISSILRFLGGNEYRVPSVMMQSQNLKKHLRCNFTKMWSPVVPKTGI